MQINGEERSSVANPTIGESDLAVKVATPNDDHPWKEFYDATARIFGADPFPFMNLGFADVDVELTDPEIAERLSERLYDKVLCHIDLTGRVMLEVGCGRGGGCAHIARTHGPKAVIGVDLNELLVRHCIEAHDEPGISFIRGDACRLPIADGSVDAVVNVESSHCYSSRLTFFEEVARVLRPGGRFGFADFLVRDKSTNSPEAIERYLRAAGLASLAAEDIAPGVLAARNLASSSLALRARLESALPNPKVVAWWAKVYFMHGSPLYDLLRSGEIAYWCWTAEKAPA